MKHLNNITKGLLILFLLSGCDVTRFETETDQFTREKALSDVESATAAVNGIYSQLNDVGLIYDAQAIPAFMSGYFTFTGNFASQGAFGLDYPAFFSTSLGANTNRAARMWANYYELINNANNVIYQLDGKTPDEFKASDKVRLSMMAEARFLRAFAHFNLLKFYGDPFDLSSKDGVIIREVPSELDNLVQPKSTVSETYTSVERDLEWAYSNLTDSLDFGRANKVAIRALQARILLFKGDFTNARARAQEVIDLNKNQFESAYANVFRENHKNSEAIFVRKATAVIRNFLPDILYKRVDGIDTSRVFTGLYQKSFDRSSNSRVGVLAGAVFLKPFFNSSSELNSINYIRLPEMYLIIAESIAKSDGAVAEGLSYVNAIRTKRGLSLASASNKQELLKIIHDEYVLELSFEWGHEWFSALRNGITTKADGDIRLPIPLSEINNNPAIKGD